MRYLLLLLIKFYQLLISPLLANNCRFMPTCSDYCYQAIHSFGAFYGLKLSIKRISKCHPWHKGGFDPIPTKIIPTNTNKPYG